MVHKHLIMAPAAARPDQVFECCAGMPNSHSKYSEHTAVQQRSTPFTTRLDREMQREDATQYALMQKADKQQRRRQLNQWFGSSELDAEPALRRHRC